MQEFNKPHIVILGAGFGGIRAARKLSKLNAQITLIDRHNYHLFQPLLYQVSTATLSIDDIAYPIRAMIKGRKNILFRMGEVTDISLNEKYLNIDNSKLNYDYLIVAPGGTTNFFGIDSIEQNSFSLKTLDEAVNLRNHILHKFELASYEQDAIKRHSLLTFVIVGGGPTGVESAGALSELIYLVMNKEYPTLNFKEVRIVLIEASDKVLASMPEELREATIEKLIRKHIEVRLFSQVSDYNDHLLTLKGGEIIPAATVIWAAGIKAAHIAAALDCAHDSTGRIIVNEYLQIPGHPEVFAIGDAVHFNQDSRPLPMIAPVAIQQAEVASKNIANLLSQKQLHKFIYKDVGSMATIGRNAAVVHMGKIKLSGFIAWSIWLFVHILRLVDFRNRFVVLTKWVWEYLFYERLVRIITRQ